MLTVMEMGRLDYMVRTGFIALATKRKWFYTAGAISIQFLRPLKAFQKAQLETRVFHMDEQWIYLEHKITRKGKNIAVAIVKCTVKQGRKRVPYSRIVEELGLGKIPHEGRKIIKAFEEENVLVKKRILKNKADR